ncbi:hypothetical protein FRX31_030365 [Thalictrum thalictroides]|uniref:F-box domain-containing protein n=1 Tax=Thalictrum thalictroides TaxID=46969 RepID=A0A7J6V5T1_THATH|nr:hypothetical protein FRX31_030365 [Thalictrum thalictroides]
MNNNRELPEEIWMEILVYLKANDLQNYKIVSKQWRSLISYPTFINSHLSLLRYQQQPDEILITTLTSPKPSNLVRCIQYHFYSIVNSNKISMMRQKELQFPLYDHNQRDSKLVLCLQSSCEGLLLFQDKYNPKQLYISNPVTSMFKPLPPLIQVKCQCCFWALVRDTRLNKYKVFGVKSQRTFVVLTLEEDATLSSHWKICHLRENDHQRFSMLSQFLLFQNEELLWLTTDKYGEPAPDALNCYCIHSINIETLIFSKINIPPYVLKVPLNEFSSVDLYLKCKGARHLLSELNGSSLCLTTVSESKLEMFVLEDRLKCVWTKSHVIHLKSLLNRHYSLKTFFVDICLVTMRDVDKSNLLDLVKVLIHHEDQLLLYDLKSQECRKIGFLEKDQKLCRHYLFHSNSLVSWD